jgi:hypothetical protein
MKKLQEMTFYSLKAKLIESENQKYWQYVINEELQKVKVSESPLTLRISENVEIDCLSGEIREYFAPDYNS